MLEQFGKEATDLRWLSLVSVRGEKTKGPYMSIALRMRLRGLCTRGPIFSLDHTPHELRPSRMPHRHHPTVP